MIQTMEYERIPFPVEAVQVTEDNMADVAAWCEGRVFDGNGIKATPSRPGKYINVKVVPPAQENQTRAAAGDWVLKTKQGFKVYNDRAFTKNFRLISEVATIRGTRPEELIVHRDASNGQFVTEEFAETNPDTTVEEKL